MGDWRFLSAAEMGRKIDAGDLDPVELAEGYLDAATQHPQGTQIYARLTPDRALNEAKAAHARAKAGRRKGPLDGVPMCPYLAQVW